MSTQLQIESDSNGTCHKEKRRLLSKLSRLFVGSLRLFFAVVIGLTIFNVVLGICDVFYTNYTLWLSSTVASCVFCLIVLAGVLAIYFSLKKLTKSMSK